MHKPGYKLAVGLHYDENQLGVPLIGVKGEMAVADQVVKLAQRFNVPVVENPEVARATHALPIDHQIPKELFKAVAVILNAVEKKGNF